MTIRNLLMPATAALLALGLAGCGNRANEQTGEPSTQPGVASQVPPDVPGAALGTVQTAGDFSVNFRVEDAAVKQGENQFVAVVTRDGAPVTDATVNVVLSMPAMNMYGSEIVLRHTDAGRYEATGNITMAGDWQADVTVTSGGAEGKTVYDFHIE